MFKLKSLIIVVVLFFITVLSVRYNFRNEIEKNREVSSEINKKPNYTGELRVFVVPSTLHINWSTPRSLMLTYLSSYVKRLAKGMRSKGVTKTGMGHGIAYINCVDEENNSHDLFTAITGQDLSELTKAALFKQRLGLLVFMMNYPDGHIESSEHLQYFLAGHEGRISTNDSEEFYRLHPRFLEYPVTAKQCSNLYKFHKAYSDVRKDESPSLEEVVTKWKSGDLSDFLSYGMFNEPVERYETRKLQLERRTPSNQLVNLAAGCTSYAQSFIKVAGYYEPQLFDNFWKRDLTVGLNKVAVTHSEKTKNAFSTEFELLNIFLDDNEMSKKQKAGDSSFLDLLIADKEYKTWEARNNGPNITKSFYDPEKMYDFFDGAIACYQKANPYKYNKEVENIGLNFESNLLKTSQGNCKPEIQAWLQSGKYKPSLTKLKISGTEGNHSHESEFVGLRLEPQF